MPDDALTAASSVDDAPRGTGQDSSAPVSVRPGETALVDWVEGLVAEARIAKRTEAQTDQWDVWEDGFWGDIWTQDLPTFKPPVVINELQSNILMEVSDLTDSPIETFVMKREGTPDRAVRDKQVEKAFQANWVRDKLDEQVMAACLDAFVFPCGFLQVWFDPMGDNGRGKVMAGARDPRTVIPDPDATSEDDWTYVILEDVFDLTYIRSRWPVEGARVRPDATYSSPMHGTERTRRGPMGLSGRYQGPLYAGGAGSQTDGYAKARAPVWSLFIKDDEVDIDNLERTIEQLNDETGEKVLTKQIVSVKRRKYPYGRLIQVSNGVVLYDQPLDSGPRFPLIRVTLQPTVHRFWPPVSVVGSVLEVYKAANKLDSLVVENGIRLNGGMGVAPTTSGIDPAKMACIPGQWLLVPPGQTDQVKILYPPPMPADMIQNGARLRQYAAGVLGMRESRVGQGQRGNVSPELTETEITQAMGLTRLRGRLLHSSVQKFVEVLFSAMAKYYRTPRIIPHKQGDDWVPVSWDPIVSPEDYAIHADPASFQVKARTQLQRLYLTLGLKGMLPLEDTLSELEIPDAKEKAAKVMRELELKAAANLKQKGKKRG